MITKQYHIIRLARAPSTIFVNWSSEPSFSIPSSVSPTTSPHLIIQSSKEPPLDRWGRKRQLFFLNRQQLLYPQISIGAAPPSAVALWSSAAGSAAAPSSSAGGTSSPTISNASINDCTVSLSNI